LGEVPRDTKDESPGEVELSSPDSTQTIDFNDPEILHMLCAKQSPDPNIKPLDHVNISGGKRTVVICPCQLLNTAKEEYSNGKIVKRVKLGFVFYFRSNGKDYYFWCTDDCENVISKVAKSTNYHVTVKALTEKINELRSKQSVIGNVSIVDYVKQKFPNEFAEIQKDQLGFVLTYLINEPIPDKYKIAVLLSIVSAFLDKAYGIYRIPLMIVGNPRVGKSTILWSVAKHLKGTEILIDGDDVTPNWLVYNDEVDNYDGKVILIEQLDYKNLRQILEATTKDGIKKKTVEQIRRPDGTIGYTSRTYFKPGQPVFLTTSVYEEFNVNKVQRDYRFFKLYFAPDPSTRRAKLHYRYSGYKKNSTDNSQDGLPMDKYSLVFLAYLHTIPKDVDMSGVEDIVYQFLNIIGEFGEEAYNMAMDIMFNLIRAIASFRGKNKADKEDVDFILKYFRDDIIFNALGFSEREYRILYAISMGYHDIRQIKKFVRMSKKVVRESLFYLDDQGFVTYDRDEQNNYIWRLDELGIKLLDLIDELRFKESGNISERVIEIYKMLKEKMNGNTASVDEVTNWVSMDTLKLFETMGLVSIFEDPRTHKQMVRLKDFNLCVHTKGEQKCSE
jgi:hypothetical protein